MRFDRKGRTDIIYKGETLSNLIDNAFKKYFCLNDSEYEFILVNLTEEEFELATKGRLSFAEKRILVLFVEKYLCIYRSLCSL